MYETLLTNEECASRSFLNKNITILSMFESEKYKVYRLFQQMCIRDSTNPDAYIESNLIGFYNILEACRHYGVEHLV